MAENQGYKSITGLVDIPASSDQPQFSTAEYAQSSAAQHCSVCNRLIADKPQLVNSKIVCAQCASAASASRPVDSHANFVGGIVFGAGAAILGLAFYAGFTIVTHFYIGYIALAVGWLVGKAVMIGSKGVGGQRYQVAAVLLTYAAISLAAVPIYIAALIDRGTEIDWASQLGPLALYGIASPFLRLAAGPSHLIGLVILFVGLRVAYRTTAAQKSMVAARATAK